MTLKESTASPAPVWFFAAAGLGLLWSICGIFKYVTTVGDDVAAVEATGMTPHKAALMAGLPLWMSAAFAIGVFGGSTGAAGLLRARWARMLLMVALAAYAVLRVGDLIKGVFAAFGAPQIATLTLVVAVASGLVWLHGYARSRGRVC